MENNTLDALLEDLQSSVARTTQMNGPSTTRGYREITRTFHSEGDGVPPTTSREYQIEYLTPANSTTILNERSTSPGLPPPPPELLNSDTRSSNMAQSYKQVSYQNYHTSSKASESSSNAALLASAAATTNSARQVASLGSGNTTRLRGNISELDNLLDDLNSSQRQGYATRKEVTTHMTRSEGGSHSGPLPPPLEDPIPLSAQHVSRASQRSFSERRYGSVGRQSPSPHRYVSTSLDRATASPLPKRSSSSQRDVVFSSSRSGSPSGSPAPGRSVVHKEVYRYESKTSSGAGGTGTTRYREPSPGPRPPSPTLERITNTVRNYDFNSTSNTNRSTPHRPPSPASYGPGSKTISSSTTYNYNSMSSSARPPSPRTPPPHRSPSPVSFPPPPEPHGVPFGYTQTTTTTTTRHRSKSPQLYQKFSPSDPSSGSRHHSYQVSNQKYSSSSSSQHQPEQSPLLPRPFPTPSPDPGEQRPPKQLDELMSSFETDSTQTSVRQYASNINAQTRATTEATAAPAPATPPPPPPPQDDRMQTRNVAGPPVYYPPGVDMFSKKEETLQFAEGGGKYKGKAKAKYEYESKSKMKEKSSQGGAVVPVCLPLCCAMPCTIM